MRKVSLFSIVIIENFQYWNILMDDLSFISLLTISQSYQNDGWVIKNEKLCAMESHLGLKRFLPQAVLKLGIARSAGQRLTH